LYDNIQYADGSTEDRSAKEIEKEVSRKDDLVDAPASSSLIDEGEKKKGILRKLNLHKV
jgi:hypothetical protein